MQLDHCVFFAFIANWWKHHFSTSDYHHSSNQLTFHVLWCLSGHCSRRLCADSDCHLNLARSTVDGAAHGHHICLSVIRSPEDQKSRRDPDCSFTQDKALHQEGTQRKGMLPYTQNYEKVKISPPEMLRPLQIESHFYLKLPNTLLFYVRVFFTPAYQNSGDAKAAK